MKTFLSGLLIVSCMLVVTLVGGCGIVGYEAKMKAKFVTDELTVTLEKTSATKQEKAVGLNIDVVNDPNGMLRLTYSADLREVEATSHKPDETLLAAAEVVKALPADFWIELARAANEWLDNNPPDSNQPDPN